MDELLNKPRVFISYASDDTEFIDRVQKDLTRCQILSWRDQTDIRDGRPWMEAIFENGIPTCDAILAYFTESSLKSRMMGREVDAAFLLQLKDNTIAFLPYVSSPEVRNELRTDIQTLHCRVWGNKNYFETLPLVTSEIWRSFLDRTIANVSKQEKTRRLEAELALERLERRLEGSIFTAKEEREFTYLRDRLDEVVSTSAELAKQNSVKLRTPKGISRQWRVSISTLFFLLSSYWFDPIFFSYPNGGLENIEAESDQGHQMVFDADSIQQYFDPVPSLIKIELINPTHDGFFRYKYTKKMHRFKYWMEYNQFEPCNPTCSYKDWDSKNHKWLE